MASSHAASETADAELPTLVMSSKTVESTVGKTPLVRLQRTATDSGSVVLLKLEGNNPAGSVKDRPALRYHVTHCTTAMPTLYCALDRAASSASTRAAKVVLALLQCQISRDLLEHSLTIEAMMLASFISLCAVVCLWLWVQVQSVGVQCLATWPSMPWPRELQ
jgi:hypothetical protein